MINEWHIQGHRKGRENGTKIFPIEMKTTFKKTQTYIEDYYFLPNTFEDVNIWNLSG